MNAHRVHKTLLTAAACVASAWAAAQGGAPASTRQPGTMDCHTASASSTDAVCSGALSSGTAATSGALLVQPEVLGRTPSRGEIKRDAAASDDSSDGGANLPGNNSTGNNSTRGADRSNQNTRSGD